MPRILILGGARSGKSRYAMALARQQGDRVLFVATATAGDAEMAERIARHRQERPAAWRTLEASCNIAEQLERQASDAVVVIIDCVTMLVSNILCCNTRQAETLVNTEIHRLLAYMAASRATFILVSNEVGLGLVPPNRAGRDYRDLLGRANQELARQADVVYLMVAGLPLMVKGHDNDPRFPESDTQTPV